LSFGEFTSAKGFSVEKEFTTEDMFKVVLGGEKEEFQHGMTFC
jgi:hypothetical protein